MNHGGNTGWRASQITLIKGDMCDFQLTDEDVIIFRNFNTERRLIDNDSKCRRISLYVVCVGFSFPWHGNNDAIKKQKLLIKVEEEESLKHSDFLVCEANVRLLGL